MIDPVLKQEETPDHGSAFWAEFDQAFDSEALAPTTETPTVGVSPAPRTRSRSRARWPLVAAAAAVLTLGGLGVVVLGGDSEPATTDVVSGLDESSLVPLDGPSTDGADGDSTEDATTDDATTNDDATTEDPPPATLEADASIAVDAPTPLPTAQSVQVAPSLDELPTYELAAGNTSTQVYVPTEPFDDGARFLGTLESARLSWFSITDPATGCSDPAHAEIRYVPEPGFNLDFADPNPRFSGNISQFTTAPSIAKVAWLAECAGQLELYVADLGPVAGQASNIRLAWVGEGSSTAASMTWSGSEVSLNSISPTGEPFFVAADMATGRVTGSGVRADVGDGTGRSSWIVGASPSGHLSWWNGNQTTGATSCDGQTLFLHSDASGWQPAFVEPVDTAAVTQLSLNPDLSQVAFTDGCDGINNAQVFLGTVRADGLISSVRTIDLSLWATGNVSLVRWEDPLTLRIHTDDSNTGGSTQRFNYVFDDGRDAGVLVQLD